MLLKFSKKEEDIICYFIIFWYWIYWNEISIIIVFKKGWVIMKFSDIYYCFYKLILFNWIKVI